jgi:hypothetical protein
MPAFYTCHKSVNLTVITKQALLLSPKRNFMFLSVFATMEPLKRELYTFLPLHYHNDRTAGSLSNLHAQEFTQLNKGRELDSRQINFRTLHNLR